MPALSQWGGGGGAQPTPGGSGSRHRIRQPLSPTVSATVLHDTPTDAGGGRHVYSG